MELQKLKALKLSPSFSGRWLCVKRGTFWVTLTGDSRDLLLQAGESLWCPPRSEVVVQALETGEFSEKRSDRARVVKRATGVAC